VQGVLDGIGNGIDDARKGKWGSALLNFGLAGIDIATAGKGSVLKNGVKEGAELALKRGGREVLEEGLETGSKKVAGSSVVGNSHSVYVGYEPDTRNIKYVGRTGQEPSVRFGQHKRSDSPRAGLDYDVYSPESTGMTLMDARILEQQLINEYGLGKNGGQLLNAINSIAPKYWSQYGL
jgi:hypothetical protein